MVRGSDCIAEELRVQTGGSRMLKKAGGVLASFLEGESGRKGIMTAKALSNSVSYAVDTGASG